MTDLVLGLGAALVLTRMITQLAPSWSREQDCRRWSSLPAGIRRQREVVTLKMHLYELNRYVIAGIRLGDLTVPEVATDVGVNKGNCLPFYAPIRD